MRKIVGDDYMYKVIKTAATPPTPASPQIATSLDVLRTWVFEELYKCENCLYGMITKEIKKYVEEYHFTYEGIKATLIYYYWIKKNPLEAANGHIGIVPYKYKEAERYFRILKEKQHANDEKKISEYAPEIVSITISRPTIEVKPPKLFKME